VILNVSTYLTDSWSTISGLASVAYGSPTRYPEVANQVGRQLATRALGNMPPSEVLSNRLSVNDFVSALTAEYEKGEEFARYVDSGNQTVADVSKRLYRDMLAGFDQIATYESSITDVLEYINAPVNTQRVKNDLVSRVPDLELFSRLAANMVYGKLDKLPSGTLIDLNDNVSLDSDSNGVAFTTGYLTPDQYYSGVAYPGVGSTGNNLPGSFVTSLVEGYKGYATLQPLDDLLRPGLADLVSLSDINDIRGVSRAISGLGTINTAKDLGGLGVMSKADQAMYSVDLTKIVVGINGYTVYDPATDSNGDFIDTSLIPDYEGENADSGLPYSSRTRTSTF